MEASGPIGFCILLLSIYFTAVVIRLFLEFRVTEAVPPALIEKLDTSIKDRKFQETYDVCRDDNSFLARLVRTGIANLPNGRPEAKESMNDVADEIVTGMEAKISYLATIGTLGPMIGLVGTIWGMIQSFQELATAGGQPKPDKLAAGISTALFITLEGVSLSVPAIFFFALFRNRIALIATEANKVADRTINAFYTAAKQGKANVGAGV
jgi:biopolymer transport protein ExbB